MNVREWALPVYTILMQISTGAMFFLWIIRSINLPKYGNEEIDRFVRNPVIVVFITGLAAIIGSHFHLSKPYLSFLAALNFRSSWLSREIVFTTLFILSVSLLLYIEWFKPDRHRLKTALGWAAILFGAVNVYCMARIYILPTQVAWNSPTTIVSYGVSTLLLGGMSLILLIVLDYRFLVERFVQDLENKLLIIRSSYIGLSIVIASSILLLIVKDFYHLANLRAGDQTAQLSLELLLGLYQPLFLARVVIISLVVIGILAMFVMVVKRKRSVIDLLVPLYITCLLLLVGEIIGRFLFYATHIRIGF